MSLPASAQNTLIQQIHSSLAAAGAVGYSQLSAPESVNSNHVTTWLRGSSAAYSSAALADIAQVNTHDYASQEGGSVYGTAQALGKPVMMSEWGAAATSSTASDMSAGITLSERILKNEQQMHPASWVIWQAVDGGPPLGPGCVRRRLGPGLRRPEFELEPAGHLPGPVLGHGQLQQVRPPGRHRHRGQRPRHAGRLRRRRRHAHAGHHQRHERARRTTATTCPGSAP